MEPTDAYLKRRKGSADEHCRPLSVSISTDIVTPPLQEDNQQRFEFIQKMLADQKLASPVLALDNEGKPAFSVQVRSVEFNGQTIVNLCNQTRRPVIVNLTKNGSLVSSTDLLSLTDQLISSGVRSGSPGFFL